MTSTATTPSPAKAAFGPGARVGLALVFVALVVLRMPIVAFHGRFYAEEGAFFLAYAWHMPWAPSLFHPLGGYLNIAASASALFTEFLLKRDAVSLENAPFVTEAIGLFFQTCPAILLLTSRAQWLDPRWALPCALAMLALAPMTEEVWLQTLHIQFHLALCAGIILATDEDGSLAMRMFRYALLFLGPLCGPGAIVLIPFFIARAALDRSKERGFQTLFLLFGAALQLGLFYVGSKSRGLHIEPAALACVMFVRHVLLPLLGPDIAMRFAEQLHASFAAGATPWRMAGLAVFVLGAWVLMAARNLRGPTIWLVAPGLGLAAISYIGALRSGPLLLDVEFATRYTYVPQALLGFSLLAFAATEQGRFGKYAGYAAAWIVVMGIVPYFHPLPGLADGPDWRTEVAAWRQDPQHRLATWPKRWFIDLAPTDAKCSPDPAAKDQPDFCDQYWEAM